MRRWKRAGAVCSMAGARARNFRRIRSSCSKRCCRSCGSTCNQVWTPGIIFRGRAISGVWLEIGFGAGEHLLWQVEHHPDVGLIGAEPYVSGIAKLLSRLSLSLTEQEENIRIHDNDARDILEALPDASLGRVFILFPDPWPKSRHHKRRFIQMSTLDVLARVMKPGAELRFASDDADYAAWTLERIIAHPVFEWTAMRAQDWTTRPSDWPKTRYEEKALHGPPAYFAFRRI